MEHEWRRSKDPTRRRRDVVHRPPSKSNTRPSAPAVPRCPRVRGQPSPKNRMRPSALWYCSICYLPAPERRQPAKTGWQVNGLHAHPLFTCSFVARSWEGQHVSNLPPRTRRWLVWWTKKEKDRKKKQSQQAWSRMMACACGSPPSCHWTLKQRGQGIQTRTYMRCMCVAQKPCVLCRLPFVCRVGWCLALPFPARPTCVISPLRPNESLRFLSLLCRKTEQPVHSVVQF